MSQSGAPVVLIVGAGLAGSLLAVYLAKLGYRVVVCERRGDPRSAGYIGGRSINLALSVRGITGLRGAGLEERVLERVIPMRGRMVHPPSVGAEPVFQAYSANPQEAINSVSRSGLNLTLLEAAGERAEVELRFDSRCDHVDLDAGIAEFFDTKAGRVERIAADLIVGADGAFSAVRQAMMKVGRFNYSQEYLEHGYKELRIPPLGDLPSAVRSRLREIDNAGGWLGGAGEDRVRSGWADDGFALPPNALHIWPRGGSMMIALPNQDRSFTCTLFWPFDGEHGFAAVASAADAPSFFAQHYPDALELMPDLAHDYAENPTSTLVTVRCSPWNHGHRVLLLGDAAHAIVPFFGQGMNAAFEDCRILSEMLSAAGGASAGSAAFERVVPEFARRRKPDADAIAQMAVENFYEMRDAVGRPGFRYKKRVEQALHGMLPERVHPLYNMVSFSNVPYAEALQRGRALDAQIEEVMRRVPEQKIAGGEAESAWRANVLEAGRAVLGSA